MEQSTGTVWRIAGVMSGTSLDGVDVAFVEIVEGEGRPEYRLLDFVSVPYEPALRERILCACVGNMNMRDFLMLDSDLGAVFAEAIASAAESVQIPLPSLDAVGLHGQTVWHAPDRSPNGITTQIGSAALVAERLGTVVVSDFRSGDVAAGGEGAPLVPFFDMQMLASPELNRVALNIGGMANLSWLPSDVTPDTLTAFDTGPGNCMIDAAMADLRNVTYDAGGEFAAQGQPNENLLDELYTDPWFQLPPPKSTGREKFGTDTALDLVSEWKTKGISDADIIATLTAFTARTIVMGIRLVAGDRQVDEVLVSGGGVHNRTLLEMIQSGLTGTSVLPVEHAGISSDAKEAFCFAVLAHARLGGIPNNVPSVTGASRPVIGGAVYAGHHSIGQK